MASGIPVITSDIGGIRELVETGVTGFLVPPTDSRALADTIEGLRAEPNLRRAMGEKARGNIQQSDLRMQVAHMLEIFRELNAGRRGQRALDLHILLYVSDAHWGTYLREILRGLAELERRVEKQLLVCRMGLSDEETLRSGKLLLLPTAGQEALSQALHAFQRQIPIVVEEFHLASGES
jgi:Glycosyl transferases group 1